MWERLSGTAAASYRRGITAAHRSLLLAWWLRSDPAPYSDACTNRSTDMNCTNSTHELTKAVWSHVLGCLLCTARLDPVQGFGFPIDKTRTNSTHELTRWLDSVRWESKIELQRLGRARAKGRCLSMWRGQVSSAQRSRRSHLRRQVSVCLLFVLLRIWGQRRGGLEETRAKKQAGTSARGIHMQTPTAM